MPLSNYYESVLDNSLFLSRNVQTITVYHAQINDTYTENHLHNNAAHAHTLTYPSSSFL